MITKKERIMGKELTFEFSPLEAVRHYFGAKEAKPSTITMHTKGYREYRKKIVEEGRLTQWGGLTTGAEKEKIGIMRMRERQKRESGF